MYKRVTFSIVTGLALAGYAMAQTNPHNDPKAGQQPTADAAPRNSEAAATSTTTPGDAPSKPKDEAASKTSTPSHAPVNAPVNATKIPSGSRVYVAPMGGFENYVVAGIVKKKVPVVIVADRDKAEYEIRGSAETERAGWAKMLFMGSQNSNEQASINVTEIKSGDVVFAYSVNKLNSYKGKQSAGEAIGKHLNEAVGKD
jgi:hypothetical protein